jgi:hypothetical protein
MRGLRWRSLLAEQRRMRLALGAALVAVAPLGVAVACGESSPGAHNTTPRDGAADAASPDGGSPHADAAIAVDADAESACLITSGLRDAATDTGPDADADPGCWYRLPCGFADSGLVVVGCDLYKPDPPDASLADRTFFGCRLAQGKGCEGDAFAPGPNGAVMLECTDCIGGGGRRPAGLEEPPAVAAADALGAYFGSMAHEEAASVIAFDRLRDELLLWGAPAFLIGGAEQARQDEIRHARIMAQLARQHGARIATPRVRGENERTLESIAHENAIEGCVHETYGAALLAWQARFATDHSFGRIFAVLAEDEARHAALSWAVARWLDTRLDSRARVRITRARHDAVQALRSRLQKATGYSCDALVGRPTSSQALGLLEALEKQLL